MPPSALISVYREYKKDTNSIASWLASTARECGYTSENLPAPKPKAKHRAGKKNKKKASEPYIIEIKEFVTLADFISSYEKPALSVPKAFFNTLNRVISVRNGFSEELSRLNKKKDVKSDAKHSYFVSILEKVRQLLKPFAEVPGSGSSDTVNPLTNKFDALKVYEPSQEFLNAPDVERPAQVGKDKSTYEADPSDSLNDALVAYYMMCRDLKEIRDFVQGTWRAMTFAPRDEINGDPAVLAVMTNVAVEFGNSVAEEVMPVFEKYGGYRAIAHELITTFYADAKGKPKTFDKMDDLILQEFYEPFSLFYVSTASCLEDLAAVPYSTSQTFLPDGTFGIRNFTKRWDLRSTRQKVIEDRLIISELWYECFLIADIPEFPFTDEFIRGFKEFKETNKIPFKLVFAAQINLDVQHVIGDYADSTVPLLTNRVRAMNDDLKAVCKKIKNIRSPNWSAQDQKWLETKQAGFDWFLDDPIHKLRTLHVRKSGNAREEKNILSKIDKWRVLKRSPVIAGMALYYYRAESHEAGLKVTNAWNSIILPAHLYNAVTQEGGSDCFWKDMDTLWLLFGEHQFFVGGPPRSYSDYSKRFMLQVGLSAATFSKERLLRGALKVEDFTKKGPRLLVSRAVIHKSLQKRYHKNENQMAWTTESISAILSGAEGKGWITEEISAYINGTEPKDKSNEKAKETKTPKAEDIRVSPVDILCRLGNKMQEEVSELAWPYMTMHLISWRLLDDVRFLCEPYLRKFDGGRYKLKEWELPLMCGQILSEAEDSEQWSESLLDLAGKAFDIFRQTGEVTLCARKMQMLAGFDTTVPKKVLESCKITRKNVQRRTEEFTGPQQPESDSGNLPLDEDEMQADAKFMEEMKSFGRRLESLVGKLENVPLMMCQSHLAGFYEGVAAGDIDTARHHVTSLENAVRASME
ncbi:hypothetical protein FSST1_001314 [Fusarium sambucinum]